MRFFPKHLLLLLAFCLPSSAQVSIKPIDPKTALTGYNLLLSDKVVNNLVYSIDNVTYGSAGLNWPWKNELMIKRLSKNRTSEGAYEVFRKKYDVIFNARWVNERQVIFNIGDPFSSFGTYDLALVDTSTQAVQTLQKGLSWKQVWPSPSGRFIVFIGGGGQVPFAANTSASLCTLDLQTKKLARWGKGDPLFNSVAWGAGDTLFFSLAPTPTEQKTMQPDDSQSQALAWKPTIYAASLATGKIRQVLRDALRPAPSPNGKYLVSLSYHDPTPPPVAAPVVVPDPTMPRAEVNSLVLLLSHSDGSQPRLIRAAKSSSFNIVWFPDATGFLICETQLVARTVDKVAFTVNISRYDLASATSHRVGEFRYFAPEGIGFSEDDRLWRPIAVTRDKKYLMSELTQFEDAPNKGLMLQRLDLQTGAVEIVARTGSVRGLDWRETAAK